MFVSQDILDVRFVSSSHYCGLRGNGLDKRCLSGLCNNQPIDDKLPIQSRDFEGDIMGLIRKQMGMAFLLFVAVISVTLPAYGFAQSAYPCQGIWNGTIGPGTGTVSVLGSNHQISASSVVTGTFEGDTTHGSWVGTISTNYTLPDMNQKGQVSSSVTGAYVMNIVNGTVTGTSTIPLLGQFSGQLTIAFRGQEAQTGELTGTWTGTLTVTQVTYMGMAFGVNIVAPGSGQFTGTEQSAVPEFGGAAVVVFSALVTSLYHLKRRRK